MRLPLIAVMILLLSSLTPARAEEKAAPPTFNKDVAPILFQQCAACHRPGEAAPFSLLSYQDAKKRGKLIAQVTQARQMPPWKADKGDVVFRNERHLNEEHIATLQQWLAAGMPEGDKAQLPAAPTFADTWPLGKPDLVVKMPKAFHVPAEGRDIYRNFAVATGLKEDKWVKAIDFRPSASSVVHHTLFFLDATGSTAKREADSGEVGFRGGMGALGKSGAKDRIGGILGGLGGLGGEGGGQTTGLGGLGGWAVGGQARSLPDGLAYHLPKGSDLILATHFHPSGKAEEEASTVAFYFTDKPPVQRFTGLQLPVAFGILSGIDIPAGKKDFTIEDSFVLPVDVKAFGVSAHAHYLAKQFKVTATLPDGKTKTILGISDWDFAWQEQYQFKDFLDLPKGTKLHVKIVYDNSADNPRNPANPPHRVRWGKESTDEMGSITLQVVAAKEDEFSKLQAGYKKHLGDAVMNGPLKKLRDLR
jgi:mono/diheme cytochrome c family protein